MDDATWEAKIVAEIERLRSLINDEAVCKHASRRNGGRSCTIEHSTGVGPDALMGVPRVATFAGLPSSLTEYLVRSEYATLKFLETTAVPAPRAFSYGIHGTGTDHGTGVSFILMEELRGNPWTGDADTEEEKVKVWGGLADILIELEKHHFPKAGSLCMQLSEFEVSAVASDRFIVLDPRGPFVTSTAYYKAFAEQYLEIIADGQLYTEFPIDAYLVYHFLKDNAAQLAPQEGNQKTDKFYLKHVDDNGSHLLVDEQLNITGIIDWQMARIVPEAEAFGPSLVTADVSALGHGKVSLSPNDLLLADLLRKRGLFNVDSNMANEKVRRFCWGLTLETEWEYALPLANGILQAFGVGKDWSEWKESALKEYETDERLKRLIGRSL